MTTTNFCRSLTLSQKIALEKYAKRLEADEMIIHSDGSISLYCKDGIIAYRYVPTARELYKGGELR